MIYLTGFKGKIEKLIGQSVENKELLKAIEAAKSDVTINQLMMGHDVTAAQFNQVVADCVKIRGGIQLTRRIECIGNIIVSAICGVVIAAIIYNL